MLHWFWLFLLLSTVLMVSHCRTKCCKKENQRIETPWVNLKRITVCSSVAVFPQEKARFGNLINMPSSAEPSCWIRQTWLLAQLIDSLNGSTGPNSALLRLFAWSCAVCESLSIAPWWLSWPPQIHWASAMGGNMLISEPSLTLPLHFSFFESFLMESAPCSYSYNNSNSSSQHYTVWDEKQHLFTADNGKGWWR